MQIYESNSGQKFTILARDGKQCIIQFVETGSIRRANMDNIYAGKVRDMYAVSTYGVGYDGDFEKVPYWKQAKQLWRNMMKRCYCEKDLRGYFGRATVAPDWHCFANFLRDLPKLKNFDKWLQGQTHNHTKYNLDKDLIIPGCTTYSKDTCQFITESENKAAGAANGKPYSKNPKVIKG